MSCSLCHTRKEKRFCLALHDRICPQCCGAERESTLDCPSECTYLQQARQHEKPRELESLTQEELFRDVNLEQRFFYDYEHLIAGLMYGIAQLVLSNLDWTDQEFLRALTSITRATSTRAGSGLIVGENSPNPMQRVLQEVIDRMIAQYRQMEEQHLGYFQLKDSDVLRALVFLVRMGHSRTNGRRKSRAFLDSIREQFPAKAADAAVGPAASSSLIIP
ncbi:MAG TPA: hypothetical protein VFU86_20000 [Terriglobales bacterium]|nr:hypothetical protein [Terriglobales bacterium]